MLLLWLIYLSAQIATSISFTLTYEDLQKGIALPYQRPSFFKPNVLIRVNEDGSIREWKCPYPSYLDREESICKFPESPKGVSRYFPEEYMDIVPCAENQSNTQVAYPPSCRMYVNCSCCGIGFVMECPKYTLFNNRTKECVLPLEADCCEFPARNSGTFIGDNFV